MSDKNIITVFVTVKAFLVLFLRHFSGKTLQDVSDQVGGNYHFFSAEIVQLLV